MLASRRHKNCTWMESVYACGCNFAFYNPQNRELVYLIFQTVRANPITFSKFTYSTSSTRLNKYLLYRQLQWDLKIDKILRKGVSLEE